MSTGAFVARRNGKVFITGNSGFPKSLDVSKAIDKAAGAKREVIGQGISGTTAGMQALGPSGIKGGAYDITAPATDAARQWQGWGTALKPALEPITVARKPLTGTVAENVQQHGTGALNIDGCRVEAERPTGWGGGGTALYEGGWSRDGGAARPVDGRWPANLIHDGSGEATEVFGEAARFFYCAKASKKDRDEGLDEFIAIKTNDGRKVDADNAYQRGATLRANSHPTVKPTDLMAYLCRLVTPPGGVVLDPFMGSGSTGKACAREDFFFVGVERDPEYFKIAKARIEYAYQQAKKETT